jgi:hypothetical protein
VRSKCRDQLATLVSPGGTPRDVAAGLGGLWTLDGQHHRLVQFSTDYDSIIHRFHLRAGARVFRPGTNAFDPWAVAVGAGAVWVTDGSRALTRVDPRRRRITRIHVGRSLDGVAVDRGAVWAISGSSATVLRIDPARPVRPLQIRIVSRPGFESPYPIDVETGLGSLWVLFRRAAARLGIRPVGSARWDRERRLVARVKASRADAVFLGGYPATGGDDLVVALRRRLRPSPRVLLSDGFYEPRNLARMGRAAEGLMISIAGPPLERLGRAGAGFASHVAAAVGERPYTYSVYAGQATDLLLDAIARSDGTRASVVRQLFVARVHNGILGSFAITPNGDTTARAITVYRITHGRPGVWGLIEPPAGLIGGG